MHGSRVATVPMNARVSYENRSRDAEIVRLGKSGVSREQLARQFEISTSRVGQILWGAGIVGRRHALQREEDVAAIIQQEVGVDPVTGCWNWRGVLSRKGYAIRFFFGCRSARVHRTSWELVNGPVPQGLEIDHLCLNRRCVNPDHLALVTPQENARRSNQTARSPREPRQYCQRGHEYTAENTLRRADRPASRECRTCNLETKRASRRTKREEGMAR